MCVSWIAVSDANAYAVVIQSGSDGRSTARLSQTAGEFDKTRAKLAFLLIARDSDVRPGKAKAKAPDTGRFRGIDAQLARSASILTVWLSLSLSVG
jgi:hypothetical protein